MDPGDKSYQVIYETPDKVGAKVKMVVDSDGKTMEMIETVTKYKANEIVELSFKAGDMLKTDNYSFITCFINPCSVFSNPCSRK